MSKKNLQAQLNNINKKRAGFRKDIVDRKRHIHILDINSITDEVRHQISVGTRKNRSKERIQLEMHLERVLSDKIKKLIVAYVVGCKRNLLSKNSSTITVRLTDEYAPASGGYSIEAYNNEGSNKSIFSQVISYSRKAPLTKLKQSLFKLLYDEIMLYDKLSTTVKKDITGKMRSNIFGKLIKEDSRKYYAGGLLEIGHGDESSVIKKELEDSFSSIETEVLSLSHINIPAVVNLGAFVAANRLTNKEVVFTAEQSKQRNNEQAKFEGIIRKTTKNLLEDSIKEIDSYIKSMSVAELANLETSSGQVDKVIGTIASALDRPNAKTSTSAKSKKTATKSKECSSTKIVTSVEIPITTIISKESLKSSKKIDLSPILDGEGVTAAESTSSSNWASLITIINKKLPEQVTKNMGGSRLNYRTGRLANSAEVTNIETTKDGYPSIVYNYQRDPYDVFDRTLGKAPWNIPARDPRTLVDKSVREIVQELAIGRFYTRRA